MKNKILSDLFKSAEFNSCISKMRPVNLQEELRAEVALILCELPEEKVIGMHESGGLRYYTVRVILNLAHSNTSQFYRKFRMQFSELVELADTPAEEFDFDKERKNTNAIAAMDELHWYDREMLKLYAKHGSYRAVEAETGIAFTSIHKTVQRACKIIRNKVA